MKFFAGSHFEKTFYGEHSEFSIFWIALSYFSKEADETQPKNKQKVHFLKFYSTCDLLAKYISSDAVKS